MSHHHSLGYGANSWVGETMIEMDTDDVPLIDPTEPPPFEAQSADDSLPLFHDLDQLYQDIYGYYKDHGYSCKLLNIIFASLYIIFALAITVIFVYCVDYSKSANTTNPLYPSSVCIRRINLLGWSLIVFSIGYAIFKLLNDVDILIRYKNIRNFYRIVLKIHDDQTLRYLTWNQIQDKIICGQSEHRFCQHTEYVNKLTIHNRMLRFVNYQISLVDNRLLKPSIRLPLIGEICLFTKLFDWMFKQVVFGSGLIFKDKWNLNPEVKSPGVESQIAESLFKKSFQLALILLILSPALFLLTAIDTFYTYTQTIRTNPGILSRRMWSPYGRLYSRHLNELEHDLDCRLRKAYEPGVRYLDTNFNPVMNTLVLFGIKILGPVVALIFVQTIITPSSIIREGVILSITAIGLIYNALTKLLVDERELGSSEEALQNLIREIHYGPPNWQLCASRPEVRSEIDQLLPPKILYVLLELLSPIISPIAFWIHMKSNSACYVRFFRDYSAQVEGIGDICVYSNFGSLPQKFRSDNRCRHKMDVSSMIFDKLYTKSEETITRSKLSLDTPTIVADNNQKSSPKSRDEPFTQSVLNLYRNVDNID